MAGKPVLTAADLLDKRALLELEKLDQVLEEIVATEKELLQVTSQLGKIQKKTSKEAVKRQEDVLKVTKKLNTVKTKQVNGQIKYNNTLEKANKLRKIEESGIKTLTNRWDKFQRTINKAVAAYAAITVFINSFKKLKDTVITLDSFNVLMTKVTGNTADAADSMAYLIKISKDFGISLNEATQRYSKFFAAANQAGLTVEETRKIFTSMAKTSGILSLRAEELRGVFLALEQMLSKGKVTTEELRRQLGERLPGAFGIMARAVGVTTSELDVMLKKGLIISKDILPKFAEEMEKAFGIENTDRVDTAVASFERAGTAYFELIREIEHGGTISDTIKASYNLWTHYVEQFTQAVIDSRNEHLKWYEQLASTAAGALGLGSFYGLTPEAREEQQRDEEKILLVQKLTQLQSAYILDSENLTDEQKKQFDYTVEKGKNEKKSLKQLRKEIELLESFRKNADELLDVKKEFVDDVKTKEFELFSEGSLTDVKLRLAAVKKAIEKLGPTEKLRKELLTAQADEYQRQLDILNGIELKLEDIVEVIEDEDVKDSFFGSFEDLFNVASGRIKKQGDLSTLIFGLNDEKLEKKFKEQYQGPLDDSLESRKKFNEAYNDFIKNEEDIDQQKFDLSVQITNELFEIGNALFDRRLENINAEIQATEYKYDRLIELAEGDDEKQRQLQEIKLARLRELEKEELKVRQKQAKLEKAQAMFNIGINTAVGITKVMPNPYLIALVAALGLAQLAVVAAKPIPQYKHGRIGGGAEMAIVGDGGQSEIISGKRGAYKTPSKPTLAFLEKGDSVYRNENAYKDMLKRTTYKNINMSNNANLDSAIERGLRKAKINNYLKLPTLKVDINHQLWLSKNSQF